MNKGYNSFIPHLNITLPQAVKLHWALNKILKKEFSRLEIYNQIINYNPSEYKQKRAL